MAIADRALGRYWFETEETRLIDPLVRASRMVIPHLFSQHPVPMAFMNEGQAIRTCFAGGSQPVFSK